MPAFRAADDERHLLLLGLLMGERQHGYRINDFIDRTLGRVSNMKRSTAYALLDRLHRDGLVRRSVETVGARPTRRVYALEDAGRQRFFELLRAILVQVDPVSTPADIALMFVDQLPADEAAQLLRRRRDGVRARLEQLEATPDHPAASGVMLATRRAAALARAEIAWLDRTLATGPFGTGSVGTGSIANGSIAHDPPRKEDPT